MTVNISETYERQIESVLLDAADVLRDDVLMMSVLQHTFVKQLHIFPSKATSFQRAIEKFARHTWTNGIVPTWLSFTKIYCCESSWRSLQTYNEPCLIQRQNKYNNVEQKLDFWRWTISIIYKYNVQNPLLIIKGNISQERTMKFKKNLHVAIISLI